MNEHHHSLFKGQSNTSSGPRYYPVTTSLVGKEARLVTSSADNGRLSVSLPAAADDPVFGVIGEGKATEAVIFFPTVRDLIRLKLSGTCSPGDTLTSVGDGQVEAAGEGTPYAAAEESGVDGQLVLCRPLRSVIIEPSGGSEG